MDNASMEYGPIILGKHYDTPLSRMIDNEQRVEGGKDHVTMRSALPLHGRHRPCIPQRLPLPTHHSCSTVLHALLCTSNLNESNHYSCCRSVPLHPCGLLTVSAEGRNTCTQRLNTVSSGWLHHSGERAVRTPVPPSRFLPTLGFRLECLARARESRLSLPPLPSRSSAILNPPKW
ncbi:hypothetical protein K437DRAFT_5873 [Tilletiaria anomala UBC 951]|uniref:Uncharacterized protein n=1 Tax=Tilletiaria anomala (strain ATCC 24038 / CBS 436.72 / UBC 951) TaxID=1037660 RepID=A0A066WIR1_TILAU|nr:uncharacterized protein K437DRAFT_5873 [Tilletiaria anomala UBC 951]KDN52428.1 hypothetical protein K437DRAFT_5873 [Tilletiaria anomala UBC 951]